METPFQKYRKGFNLSVSQLAEQLWCEKGMELQLIYGFTPTEEMNKGTEIHVNIENEIKTKVEVVQLTKQDEMHTTFLNMISNIEQLKTQGLCRELEIWGFVGDYFTRGFIDELKIKDKQVMVSDTKTRVKNFMPTKPQLRRNQFQLMLYHHLLSEIKNKKFTHNDFIKKWGIKKSDKISKDYKADLKDKGVPVLNTNISEMAKLAFKSFHKLPIISDEFECRYIHQETNNEIGVDKHKFDVVDFNKTICFLQEYWAGKREAQPVGENNQWKCNYCHHKDKCEFNKN